MKEGSIHIQFDEDPLGEWDLEIACTREELAFAIALLQSRFTNWMNEVEEEEPVMPLYKYSFHVGTSAYYDPREEIANTLIIAANCEKSALKKFKQVMDSCSIPVEIDEVEVKEVV